MSRIGRKPVPVPEAVTVEIAPGNIAVKGPKGELTQAYPQDMSVEQGDGVGTGATARAERRRLSVSRPTRGLFAKRVDDTRGHTVAAVNWIEPDLRKLTATDQAKKAGELIAERAKAAGVETCVFDRGGYRYHGRVRALAEGAREGGLKF